MYVAVGTKNSAKLEATKQSLKLVFPDQEFSVIAVEVESGVSDMPMSDEESICGARQRAKSALLHGNKTQKCLFGVGLEGGIHYINAEDAYFQSGWCVIVNNEGKEGIGCSGRYRLSEKLMKPILEDGKELADVMDEITGLKDVRSSQGAMGILTNGVLPRPDAYKHGIIFAFAPFVSDDKYWK